MQSRVFYVITLKAEELLQNIYSADIVKQRVQIWQKDRAVKKQVHSSGCFVFADKQPRR